LAVEVIRSQHCNGSATVDYSDRGLSEPGAAPARHKVAPPPGLSVAVGDQHVLLVDSAQPTGSANVAVHSAEEPTAWQLHASAGAGTDPRAPSASALCRQTRVREDSSHILSVD